MLFELCRQERCDTGAEGRGSALASSRPKLSCSGYVMGWGDVGRLEEGDATHTTGRTCKGQPARRYQLGDAAGVVVGLDAGEGYFTTTRAGSGFLDTLTADKFGPDEGARMGCLARKCATLEHSLIGGKNHAANITRGPAGA